MEILVPYENTHLGHMQATNNQMDRRLGQKKMAAFFINDLNVISLWELYRSKINFFTIKQF